jgi:hypothetical protein
MAPAVEPRVEVIEGRRTLVIERVRPIAPTLDLFLNGGRGPDGRLWQAFRVLRRFPLRLMGARAACMDQDHRMADWLDGFYACSDGQTRQFRLLACEDCGAVCVRDISFDVAIATADGLEPVKAGRLAPRRRDHVIGWYTGARPNQRQYT